MRDLHAEKQMTVILVTHHLREAAFLTDRISVMSARPGRIVVERDVDFPKPCQIDIAYTPEFTLAAVQYSPVQRRPTPPWRLPMPRAYGERDAMLSFL